jgi:hypothetical protein
MGLSGFPVGGAAAAAPTQWCRLRHSAAVSVPSTTAGTAWSITHPWDTEDGDASGMHSTSSNNSRVILPTAGLWMAVFFAQMATPAGASVYEGFRIVANGAGSLVWVPTFPVVACSIWGNAAAADQIVPCLGSFVCTVPGTDYLEAQMHQNGTAAKNANASTAYPSAFTVWLVGT